MATVDQNIGEIDVVSFKEQVGRWPAGTTGTVVMDFGNQKMVEVSNPLGEALDLPIVAATNLDLVEKHRPSRA
ncbi:MAG TPA: hypothetical protein VI039_07515 [Solirubrobacterales bacterium]